MSNYSKTGQGSESLMIQIHQGLLTLISIGPNTSGAGGYRTVLACTPYFETPAVFRVQRGLPTIPQLRQGTTFIV